MPQSLRVAGYRPFTTFVVEPLSSINVLVGPNNAGKSSLLEALRLVVAAGSPTALLASALARGEYELAEDEDGRRERVVELRGQLNGFGSGSGRQGFRLEARLGDGSDRVVEAELFDASERDADAPLPLDSASTDDGSPFGPPGQGMLSELALRVKVTQGEHEQSYEVPATWGRSSALRLHLRPPPAAPYSRTASPLPILLGASTDVEQALLMAWDRIEATERKAWILESLQRIAPNVVDIGMRSDAALPLASRMVVRLATPEGVRVPVGTLGEGARRLLALLIAVAATPMQVLLVDDIDLGLHHRMLDSMWSLLLDACPRFGVQLFATTHSLDCLGSLARVTRDQPRWSAAVHVHHISAERERSIAYDASALDLAIQTESEVR